MNDILIETTGDENWILSADGAFIFVAGNDGYLWVFDAESGAMIYYAQIGNDLGALALSPDGSQLAIVEEVAENVYETQHWPSNTADVSLYIVDLSTFSAEQFTYQVTGSLFTFADVAWSDHDTLQISQNILEGWSGWAPISTLELSTGQLITHETTYYSGLWTAPSLITVPGSQLVLLGQLGISVAEYFYIAEDGTEVRDNHTNQGALLGYASGVEAVSGVTADDRMIVVADGYAYLYDGQMRFLVDLAQSYPSLGYASGVTFSEDGERLFFLDPVNQSIVVLDAFSYFVVAEVSLPGANFRTLQWGEDLVVAPDGEGVFYNSAEGIRYVSIDLPAPANEGDDQINGTAGDDVLDGLGGNDVIKGLTGDDWLVGGAGTNRLDGGEGFDFAAYETADAGVNVDLAILLSQNTLGAGRDTLVLIEGLSGSLHNDTLSGDASDNYLAGYDGNDVLIGRTGNDTLLGENGDDILRGNDGNDILDGGDGNDRLEGGPGTDRLEGGNGNDTYIVERTGDTIIEIATGGYDTVYATGFHATIQSGIERLVILSGAWNATGNFVANTLIGSEEDNVLSGMGGNDILLGAGGRDFVYGGDGADRIEGEGGSDRLYGGAAADTLLGGAGWDNIWGDAGDDQLDGGNGTDRLFGGDGVDTLAGGTERDFVFGQAGNDILRGGDDDDDLHGGNDHDTLYGDAGNDWLFGGSGGDRLEGGLGNDRMQGSFGRDVLVGGLGADSFIFAAGDTAAAAAGADRITDFARADGDIIDLSALDANGGAGGDQAFAFVGTAAFSGAAGELRFALVGNSTLVEGDTNGDSVADFSVMLSGQITLLGSDFIL